MQERITEIVEREWKMFHSTRNVGGPASCQNNRSQFEIMRRSQFLSWNEALLESYLADLLQAEQDGRNLVTLKYAYMMEQTSPLEYARLADRLPAVSPRCRELVQELVAQTVCWAEEFAARYPALARRGRPIHTADEDGFSASVETYSRGELMTYSERTLSLLKGHYDRLAAAGRNLHTEVLTCELQLSGFESPEQAERLFAAQP